MKNLQPVVNPAIISSKAGVQHLVPEVEAVHDVHLWILVLSGNKANLENIGILFLSDPGVPGVRSMGPVVSH